MPKGPNAKLRIFRLLSDGTDKQRAYWGRSIRADYADRASARFWALVAPADSMGCRLWLGATKGYTGYGSTSWRGRHTGTHRVAWLLVYGEIPPGMCVLHRCDVRLCVNPDHLFLGTSRDNALDMVAKGRGVSNPVRGDRHYNAKLSDVDVRFIRAYRASGFKLKEIGDAFGVSFGAVSAIARRISRRSA